MVARSNRGKGCLDDLAIAGERRTCALFEGDRRQCTDSILVEAAYWPLTGKLGGILVRSKEPQGQGKNTPTPVAPTRGLRRVANPSSCALAKLGHRRISWVTKLPKRNEVYSL